MPVSKSPDRITLAAFLVLVVIGGSNAVAVRFSNLALPPFWGAAFRFSLAALLFWTIVWIKKIPVPRGQALKGALLLGALSIGMTYAFLYWALVTVTASLTMVVLALTPLVTLFFAWAHGQESFRWLGLLGALISFAGILFAVGNQLGSTVPLLPVLAVLGGAAGIAEGSVVYKGYAKADPIAVNAVSVSIGAAMLLAISLIAGEPRALPDSSSTWATIAYLVIIGSGILFYLFLYVLDRWTASATSYSSLLFPVATVLLASTIAGESVPLRFLLGGSVVLLGVWVGAFAGQKKSAEG